MKSLAPQFPIVAFSAALCALTPAAFGQARIVGKTYTVIVDRIENDLPVPTEATFELSNDGGTTTARLSLPWDTDFTSLRLRRENFPQGDPYLFGSYEEFLLGRNQFTMKAPLKSEEPITIELMGKPNTWGLNAPWTKRNLTMSFHDLTGRPAKDIFITATDKINKTTSPLLLFPNAEIILPETILYQDRHNALVSLELAITDTNTRTVFNSNSIPIRNGEIEYNFSNSQFSIPFLNDWSAPPPDVNIYQGVLKGQGETPLPNQPFEVFDEVTDSHIMHRTPSLNLTTNDKGEFRFALKNRNGKSLPDNTYCAIWLSGKYYVINAGTGLVVDKSAPSVPGQGQRFTPGRFSSTAAEAKPAPEDSGYIIPITDGIGAAGNSFTVQYEFSKDDQTTRAIGQVQPDGNLIIPRSEIPPITWNNNNTTFTFSVTEPTSGTRAQYAFHRISSGDYNDSRRQPFLTDWTQSPPAIGIFSGVITDAAGSPLPDCPFTVIKDDAANDRSGLGMGPPDSCTYFTGPTGEFRLAFSLDANSAFMFQRGYFLKTDAIPNQSYQLVAGQYHEISPRTVKPFEVILLDENEKPISPIAYYAAPILDARATQLGEGHRHFRLYPQPATLEQPTRYAIRDMPIPASLVVSAFGRIFEQKTVGKSNSILTLKPRPLDFSLKGKVVDIHDQPVPNATVALYISNYPREANHSAVRTSTDKDGVYNIRWKYASMKSELTAEAEGYGKSVAIPLGSIYDPVQMDGRLEGEVAGPTLVLAKTSKVTVQLQKLHEWPAKYPEQIRPQTLESGRFFEFHGFEEKPWAFKANITSPDIKIKHAGGQSIAQWEAEIDRQNSTLSVSVPAETPFTIYLSSNSSDTTYNADNIAPIAPGESVDITDKLRSAILF